MSFYRNERIEEIVERRLLEFERKMEKPLSIPLDVELFSEQVLGLSLLWEEIRELPGEVVLGGLDKERRLIVMNERRLGELEANPGRLRQTIGHEGGHWDLFVDESKLDHPDLFKTAATGAFAYRSSVGGRQIEVIAKLLASETGRRLLQAIYARADKPDEARSVNRYGAAVLMPRPILVEEAKRIDRTQWPNLYDLARRFNVSISSLRVRLEQLDLVYLDERTKTLYPCRDAAAGQCRLF